MTQIAREDSAHSALHLKTRHLERRPVLIMITYLLEMVKLQIIEELEDDSVTAEGYTIVNLGLSYTYGPFNYFITAENLFDVEWNEVQFDTESRLFHESEPASEIYFTPGNPLNLQVGISFQF